MRKSNKFKKSIFITIIFFAILIIKTENVNAASASITGSNSGTVNSPITISVTGTAAQWNLKLVVDGKVIANSSELESIENKSISFSGSYTPSSAGTKKVSIEGTITDENGTTVRSFSSKTITVSEKSSDNGGSSSGNSSNGGSSGSSSSNNSNSGNSTASSNANLRNLGVTTYDFSGFKPNVTEYNTTVPNDVTSVQIYAVPQDGAVYNVSGNTNLDVGTNRVTITVTAADKKTTKQYFIYVARKEAEETEVVPNVIEEENEEEGNEKLGLISITLDDEKNIFLEPEFKPEIYEYVINLKEDLDKIPLNAVANKQDAKIEILGDEGLKDGENTITINVMNNDETEKVEYKIIVKKNIEEEVVETSTDNVEIVNEEENNKVENVQYGWYIIGGVIGLLILILLIIFIVKKKSKQSDYDIDDEENLNEDNLTDVNEYNNDDENDYEKNYKFNDTNDYDINDRYNNKYELSDDSNYQLKNNDIFNNDNDYANNYEDTNDEFEEKIYKTKKTKGHKRGKHF